MVWIAIVLASYALSFVVVVLVGHQKDWPQEYGFLYSRSETVDALFAKLYAPCYLLAKAFGVVRLCQPQISLP